MRRKVTTAVGSSLVSRGEYWQRTSQSVEGTGVPAVTEDLTVNESSASRKGRFWHLVRRGTGNGQMQCDDCDSKNDPAQPTRVPGSLGELVNTFRFQSRVLRELSQRDILRVCWEWSKCWKSAVRRAGTWWPLQHNRTSCIFCSPRFTSICRHCISRCKTCRVLTTVDSIADSEIGLKSGEPVLQDRTPIEISVAGMRDWIAAFSRFGRWEMTVRKPKLTCPARPDWRRA